MKNMKPERRTKEELVKSNKTRKIIIIILALVLAYFIINNIWNTVSDSINPEINGSITSNESSFGENDIVDYVKGFIYGILALEYPFITKFLIFLGVIYLIQIALTITGDIIQLFLIICVIIIRFIRWSYKKIKRIDNEENIAT